MSLPTLEAERLIGLGWCEYHYLVALGQIPPMLVMLYGPRDERELEVATRILDVAYLAGGGGLRAAKAVLGACCDPSDANVE